MKRGYVNTKEAHYEDTGNSIAAQGMPGGQRQQRFLPHTYQRDPGPLATPLFEPPDS